MPNESHALARIRGTFFSISNSKKARIGIVTMIEIANSTFIHRLNAGSFSSPSFFFTGNTLRRNGPIYEKKSGMPVIPRVSSSRSNRTKGRHWCIMLTSI